MHFSRNTIVEALQLFEGYTTAQFERYLFKFHLETIASGSIGFKPARINAVIAHFLANPSLTGPNGTNIVLETIEFILKSRAGTSSLASYYPLLAHSLQLDGYSIKDTGSLTSVLPTSAPM